MKFCRLPIVVIMILCAGSAWGQPNFDCWLFAPTPETDSYQIYFDDSVECAFGGILMDPGWTAFQQEETVHAYLVLSDITGGSIQAWMLEAELVGEFTLLDTITYPSPPLAGTSEDFTTHYHYVLIEWVLLNPGYNTVSFFVRPDTSKQYETPGYLGDVGQFIAMHNLIGDRWDYEKQIMILNGFVSPVVSETWGTVKALYR
jgi:hypothetical protein